MKPVILFALLLIGSVTLAQKSKTPIKTVKPKTYKPTDKVPHTGRPYFDTVINGELYSRRKWEVLGDTAHDNNAMRYLAKLTFEELNARRVKMGKAPLIWDARLKPAAEHHAYYLDYVYFYKIDPNKDGWYMSHDEDYDIPNFEEEYYAHWRLRFVDEKYPDVFAEMGEDLTSGSFAETFADYSKDIIYAFNHSKCHWEDLTDSKWDAVYIHISPNNGVVTVIPAKYLKK